MDWANVRKIHTPPSAKRYFPPDEQALYKHNFVTGHTFSPPEAALLLVLLTKRARPLGTRGPGMGELSKARELVECNCWQCTAWWKCVVPVSLTQNVNTWDANCRLVINAQCLKQNEDVEVYTVGKSVAYSCVLRGCRQGPKVLARWRRERQQTKGLMSKTMVQHVRFESLYISLPSSAKQKRKMTKFYVFWRTWTTMANFLYLLLELNAVGACC